ncbi:uncharacterized protein LOC144566857 isoform X2 [Carex rostrata]
MVTNFSGVGIGLGMPLNAFGMGAGGGCGIGFGLGWGFGSAFGCQYRSSKVQFHGFEFNKKVEDDHTTIIGSKKQKEAQSIS